MHIYTNIYEFAASAGALEGYVYHKEDIDMDALPKWVENLVSAYQHLPSEALDEIQSSLDRTLGRAIKSLINILGEEHEIIGKLNSMVAGSLPASADDFQKKKWFQRHEDWVLTGKIIRGVKQAASFTQMDWVQEQCLRKLGFIPYPGTLNLEISGESLHIIEALQKEEGIKLIPHDPKFCTAKAFPVAVGSISGAIIIPEEDVNVHGKNIVEVMAPLRLKDALDANDGDSLTLILKSVGRRA